MMKGKVAFILILSFLMAMAVSVLAGELIDVNSAGSLELEKLYRVSPRIAGRIIAEREQNGPYLSLDDLASRVKEIGPKTIERWEGQAAALGQ